MTVGFSWLHGSTVSMIELEYDQWPLKTISHHPNFFPGVGIFDFAQNKKGMEDSAKLSSTPFISPDYRFLLFVAYDRRKLEAPSRPMSV